MSRTFTSRYGNKLPSSLTICKGYCEGMGVNPRRTINYVQERAEEIRTRPDRTPSSPSAPDEWEFVTCGRCNGTGKCSRMETLQRIPRWVWGSLTFVFTGPSRGRRDTPLDFWLRFKATFLSDLGFTQ